MRGVWRFGARPARSRRGTLAGVRAALLGALVAVSCGGKAPPPPAAPPPPPLTIAAAPDEAVTAPMTMAAAADVNPDASGRPSPVVVRIYQLRTDAAFSAADFFELYDDDQKTLGPELISRDEFVLAPSEQRVVNAVVAAETRFVGVVAAFRDIRNAQWRAVVPAPRKGLAVAVGRSQIVVTAVTE